VVAFSFDDDKTSVLPLFLTGRWFNSKEVPMEHINAEGLPEPVARAVEAMVQALREQLAKNQMKEPGELPVWRGTVIGSLTREEIYDDVA
jgi:hypothetical protein